MISLSSAEQENQETKGSHHIELELFKSFCYLTNLQQEQIILVLFLFLKREAAILHPQK